jgi:N-acyl-D-aspartate/D-glutamate deacylase
MLSKKMSSNLLGLLEGRLILGALLAFGLHAQPFDLVIAGGRVMDPETKLDAVRFVGIRNGRIAAISAQPLAGKQTLDAKGLVVAPGFIDLHSHGQSDENYRYKARDGVTTALEMEVGVSPVKPWVAEREGKALIHFGASAGHIPTRMAAVGDTSDWLPRGPAATRAATQAEQEKTLALLRQGLREGGLGIGMGIAYTPFASRTEILDVFKLSAAVKVPVFVHMRSGGRKDPGVVDALQEVIADAAATGSPLHVVHINSSSGRAWADAIGMVRGARARGLDITTEAYPYVAGMTRLDSAIFDPGWREKLEVRFEDLMWVETGERLTEKTFAERRKQGGTVITFTMREEDVDQAIAAPDVMVASDGWITEGKGHPRAAGTYARVLGVYVRERKVLTLMQALHKISYMPAKRLESFTPVMKRKGRLQVGADADIAIFDPATVIDRSTYQNPAQYSTGIKHVLVNGVVVVQDEKLAEGVFPGQPIRSAVTAP